MSGHLVTGVRRSGKSLVCVGKIKEYVEQGRPVATNLDLVLSKLVDKAPKAAVIRMPDRPTTKDFEALPKLELPDGADTHNGLIVLDECATWLNSREWGQGDRSALIDWLLHSGKYGWDLMFIVQHESLVDKQARLTLFDYTVRCKRLDRLRIPGIGRLLNALSFGWLSGNLPQVHLGMVLYGNGPGAVFVENWWYRGRELFGAYNTRQVIGHNARAGNVALEWATKPSPERPRALKPKLPRVQALADKLAPAEALATAARWSRCGMLEPT
jgi:hypothetical protein